MFRLHASLQRLSNSSTIAWSGNPDWGLGLPFPIVLAWAAALTETLGAVPLLQTYPQKKAPLGERGQPDQPAMPIANSIRWRSREPFTVPMTNT